MKITPVQELSSASKGLVGGIVTLASLLQVKAVQDAVMPFIAHHPHVATIIGALTVLGSLIANPEVRKIAGIEDKGDS